jgi:hypothetical protein
MQRDSLLACRRPGALLHCHSFFVVHLGVHVALSQLPPSASGSAFLAAALHSMLFMRIILPGVSNPADLGLPGFGQAALAQPG